MLPSPCPYVPLYTLRPQIQDSHPSPLHHIRQTPLLIPAHHVLLHPAHRPKQPRPDDAQQRREQLRRIHKHTQYSKLAGEFDKLVDLVEIVLRLDQIRGGGSVFLRHEMQHGDEGDVRGEEGDEPDAENLGYGDVED